MTLRSYLAVLVVICLSQAARADLLEDFDTLGGNDVLLEKAQALNPDAEIRIVQDRAVDRRNRQEATIEVGSVLGGDAYLSTRNIGAGYNWHFTPRWSIGARFDVSFNELRDEGRYLLRDMSATGKAIIPEIDAPQKSLMGVVNWYPLYGKMNLYDLGVVHFDVYAIGGAGRVQLQSGWAPTFTAGGGVGLWFSKHVSSRLELRWQGHEARRYEAKEAMNLTVASLQMGYLHDLF